MTASVSMAGELAITLREGPDERAARWDAKKTAIVIVDMWDDHHCKSAARRVTEMAPHLNQTVKAARDKGVLIIHAPSNCMDWYKDTPQRLRAQKAPLASVPVKFQWNHFNPEREGPLAAKLEQGGCSCDTPEPCSPSYRAWKRQNAAIEIGEADAISDDGQEVYNLLEQRSIDNVVIMGVHTNRCVLGRPFGIRQMAYVGKNVVLCRDLTDSYHRDPGRHFEGLEMIIQHVEKYWAPTMTSRSFTGEAAFRFRGDKRRE
ncbi:MAG: cysteine hydrolase family protein [bacterium]|nr:cysteine hydrolase family protein [bacterium]